MPRPTQQAITLPAPFLTAAQCLTLAKRAEEEWGYDALWLAETAGPDSFTLAGALAAVTTRVTIGTAIVPVYNRTPAVLAMSAGTLDQLADGRFVLGLGSSSHAIIGDWNGLPFEAPLGHVREAVTIVRSALAGEKTNFEGRHLRSKNFRLGSPPLRPLRIYLAALREKMLALAGELGEGLILNFQPASAMPQILAAYRAGAARVGRNADDDEVVCRFQVCITDDREQARALVRHAFGGYLSAPVYNHFLAWCGFDAEARAIARAFAARDRKAVARAMPDDLIDRIAIIGSASECREQIAGFVAAGVTTPVLTPLVTNAEAVSALYESLSPAHA